MRNYNAKKMNQIGNILPDLGKAFKRLHRPPTSSELQDAVDESIDYHQNPDRKATVSMDHVLEIVRETPQPAVTAVYGNARRKGFTAGEMASVHAENVERASFAQTQASFQGAEQAGRAASASNSNNGSTTSSDEITIDFSKTPKTKEEFDEVRPVAYIDALQFRILAPTLSQRTLT